MVRRISLGMTTRPRSSIRLTIPVAFIVSNPSLFVSAGGGAALAHGRLHAPPVLPPILSADACALFQDSPWFILPEITRIKPVRDKQNIHVSGNCFYAAKSRHIVLYRLYRDRRVDTYAIAGLFALPTSPYSVLIPAPIPQQPRV